MCIGCMSRIRHVGGSRHSYVGQFICENSFVTLLTPQFETTPRLSCIKLCSLMSPPPHSARWTAHLSADLPASVVVFLVALPLCLGIALASGAPLLAGLFSGMIGGLVVGSLSRSQLSVSGPAAGLTVIVLDGIATLGA